MITTLVDQPELSQLVSMLVGTPVTIKRPMMETIPTGYYPDYRYMWLRPDGKHQKLRIPVGDDDAMIPNIVAAQISEEIKRYV